MWDRTNRSHFYSRSHRSAPPKLVPAIVGCQTAACLVSFGVFILIAGCMFRFVAGVDSPPSPQFDTPFFNKHRTDDSYFPRILGTILISIGVIMIVCALVSIVIAFVFYRKYENERHKQLNQRPSDVIVNYDSSVPPMPGTDYPTQPGFQYQPGYQPVSQNSVYNTTIEPNTQIS